jgi:hypothetical protein
MSGLTGNNILAGSSGQVSGYEIEQSLRFEDGDSPYLTRQYSSAGNRKTYTLSCWVKRGALGDKRIFGADGSSNFAWVLQFDSSDKISVGAYNVGYVYQVVTTAVYRDVGAWYHIVVSTDTTQATASDRIKIYVNGEQETAFDTASYPSLNLDTSINDNTASRPHGIGYIPGSGGDYDGYLAELNVIDGQALDASNFGETDLLTNQWIPKKYVGTYGTNGFYLNFSNSASLGADSSGNGNNFTPTNLAATDQVLDSPTNNFATLNPLWSTSGGVFSEGNLKSSLTADSVTGSIANLSGKYYYECYALSSSGLYIGISDDTLFLDDSSFTYNQVYVYIGNNGYKGGNGSAVAYGSTYTTGDIIGVAYDLNSGSITFYKNGISQGTAFSSGFAGAYRPFIHGASTSNIVANFGQDSSFAGNKTAQNNTDSNGKGDFYYAPPSGYLALCEDNLPDPSIALPGDHFNTVLYTGDGSASNSITGVGFQPDLSWFKVRSTTYDHQLHDAVRGAGNAIYSNLTNAEGALGTVSSFDSDGFTVDASSYIGTNASGQTFVAWNWKADNTSGSSNTDGTITSTVSANPTAGFSIVKFVNASGTNQETVGHGLSQSPDLIISKNLDTNVNNWAVFHSSVCDTTSKFIQLNTTNAITTYSTVWGASLPTASVFGVTGGGIAAASANVIAYCFHEVEGYSKIGSYTGNGNADGTFVYTGFRPAFVMFKRTNSTGVWGMYDNKRPGYNEVNNVLQAQSSASELTYPSDPNVRFDIVSNGFKFRNGSGSQNASGGTYIYMAFAESPFKTSNAR